MVMQCLDWWVFELMVLASAWLYDYGASDDKLTDQDAQILVMNIAGLFYRVAMGFEQSSCTLIGRSIG